MGAPMSGISGLSAAHDSDAAPVSSVLLPPLDEDKTAEDGVADGDDVSNSGFGSPLPPADSLHDGCSSHGHCISLELIAPATQLMAMESSQREHASWPGDTYRGYAVASTLRHSQKFQKLR